MIHAHRPADERRARVAVERGRAIEQLNRESSDLGDLVRPILAHRFVERLEAVRVRVDVLVIDEVTLDQDVNDPVDEREIRSRLHRQVHIGEHRGLRDARIGDDQRLGGVRFKPLPENRMVVGDVGADQQDDIRTLEVLVRAGRAIAAKRSLIAGHGRRHAQRGVAVVIARAETKLRELAERVELLGDELACADDADGVVAVTPLHVAESRRHRLERFGPADAPRLRSPRLAKHRIFGARGHMNRLVLRQALRTQRARVDGMIGIAANADRSAVLDADEHSAAHRAVAARCRHPAIGHALRRCVTGNGIVRVGVPIGEDIEAERALEVHAASLPRYGAARCFGTALTKNK